MHTRYKYGNVGYIRSKIRVALNQVERGSITREEAARVIIEWGSKLAQKESVDIPLPLRELM